MRTLIAFLLLSSAAFAQPAEILYTAAPWIPEQRNFIADGEQVGVQNGDCDLWRLNLATGERTKLVDMPATDAIVDLDTLDGRWVVYSQIYDSTGGVNRGPSSANTARGTNYKDRGLKGADLFRIDTQTGEVVQLTRCEAESTPICGGTEELPVFNLGGCIVEVLNPDGSKSLKVIFTSNRNQLHSAVDSMAREPIMQLFAMDWDGANVELVGHMNLGGALHPFRLHDGRIAFFTHESQGNRHGKPWGMWLMNPDGTHWVPSWPAFTEKAGENSIIHWGSQAPNLRLQVVEYYPNKVGAGNLYDYPWNNQSGSDVAADNTKIKDAHTKSSNRQFPFQPERSNFTDPPTRSLVPFTSHADDPGEHVVHPRGAQGGLLVTRVVASQFGKNKAFNQIAEAGIYFLKDAEPAATVDDMVKVIDDPGVMELQAIALATPKEIYGVDVPAKPFLPNPTGTPYAYVGTSTLGRYGLDTVLRRQSKTVNPDAVRNGITSQGTDTDIYDESEIAGMRYVHQLPTPRFGKPKDDGMWTVAGDERMAVIGEVAPESDGSNLVKMWADVSWGMQLVDSYGRALTQPGTWKQLRPGEVRTDCNGCHAHTPERAGPDFASSLAGQPGFIPKDLTKEKPRLVEWTEVKAILEAHGIAAPDTLRDDPSQIVIWSARRSPLLTHIIEGEPLEGETPLSLEEIRTIAIWIDTGAAVDGSAAKFFLDTQRPTLTVSQKESGDGVALIGAADPEGPVTVSATVDGMPATLIPIDEHRWRVAIEKDAVVVATATDPGGNVTTLSRRITAGPVTPPPKPAEIQVLYETAEVLHGESIIPFGSTPVGVTVAKVFTMQNLGELPLTIETVSVPDGFVVTEPIAATLAAGESDTFTVSLPADVAGEFTGAVSIVTNDSDENPFAFQVSGTVTEPAPPDELAILRAQVAELQAQVAKLTDKIMRAVSALQEN